MFVSVIIPVYKGMAVLKDCLNALAKQSYQKLEIIVVDNGGNNGIAELCNHFSSVRLIHHKIPGSYSARNAGINVAKGEVIALTDADCLPTIDWVKNGIKWLLESSCRMGSGCIKPIFKHVDRPGFIELCDVILHTMDQEQALNECTSVACANMFVYRSLFDSIGLFNSELFSAGDCEFTYRVNKSGEKIVYMDDAVVYHYARRTLKELGQRYRRFAGAEFSSMTTKNTLGTVKQLRSLTFGYRIRLCLRNISKGILRYKKHRNPLVMIMGLLLVESYITVLKNIEYIRLGLGAKRQR